MVDFSDKWRQWLELDEKWFPKLTESLKNIEIDEQLYKMSWEEQISYLGLSWIEKGTKLKELNIAVNKQFMTIEAPSWIEKGTKSPSKKLYSFISILLFSGIPVSVDELMNIFDYRDRSKFRRNYLKLLETVGFIQKTNPEKPIAINQKYVITGKGKRFLTGQDY